MDALLQSLSQFAGVIWLDALLSGDNAVVIGLAAAGLPGRQRSRAIIYGIAFAAGLRIILAAFATILLDLWWVALAGGLALLWIAWSFLAELRGNGAGEGEEGRAQGEKTMLQAMRQIIIADVSMSLDNILAVAAVARDNIPALVFGLALSVALMGTLGSFLARILSRYRWIGILGVVLIAWIGMKLIWEGAYAADGALGLGLGIPAAP